MLLGSTANNDTSAGTELLITHLMMQQRYAEAYEMLMNQQSTQTSVLYNLAICLYWSGNYQQALTRLESIRLAPQLNNGNKLSANNDLKMIKSKQNQSDDHLNGISEAYVRSFPALVHDAIVRLKTDCWLQLGNYAKVIAVASPIVPKGYQNITDALNLAAKAND